MDLFAALPAMKHPEPAPEPESKPIEEPDVVTKTIVGVRSCMKGARKKARLAGVTFGVSVPKQKPKKEKRIVDVPSVCAKLAKLVRPLLQVSRVRHVKQKASA